jgi:hypothetical protein
MGTAHPTGFPTYILLGWLASVLLQPFGEPAFRMNLFSAICLALAAGVTVDLVRKLTGWTILGMVAGISLALTPIVWAVATHAEAHSLHLALLAILLWLLVTWDERVAVAREGQRDDRGDRYLVAAAIVFGLAVGNHSLTLLLAVPVGLYVLAVDPRIWRRGRLVLGCVAALALTIVLVYLELPLRAGPFRAALVYGTPNTLDGFRYIVLAEQFQGSLSDPFGELPRKAGELVTRAIAQFGILAPLIPVGFVVTALRRPRYALLTGSAVAITCFFNASYVNADINRYYLGPILIAWTWLAILAGSVMDWLVGRSDDDRPRGIPAPSRAALRSIGLGGLAILLLAPTILAISPRASEVDRTGDRSAQVWTDDVLSALEPNAVVVSWWSFSTPLWYATIVDGRRPDISIIDDRTRLDCDYGELDHVIDLYLPTRPVYLIRNGDWELPTLTGRFQLEPVVGSMGGNLLRVTPLPGGEAQPGSAPPPPPCAAIQ